MNKESKCKESEAIEWCRKLVKQSCKGGIYKVPKDKLKVPKKKSKCDGGKCTRRIITKEESEALEWFRELVKQSSKGNGRRKTEVNQI